MATTVSFHEVVCKGSPKAVRGLLTGLALGADLPCRFWFHHDHDIVDPAVPNTARRTAERLHLLPVGEVRVVVDGELAGVLRVRKKAIATSGVCEVVGISRIKQAQVLLKYHTFGKRYDDEIQALLRDLPSGVKLANATHDVEIDPDAVGDEAYTPVHDYESRGGGLLVGRFDLVQDLRGRFDVHPLIECGEIELVTQ
ncbi:MAG: hypothetical protein R3D98_07125 [Candidatus Krumholzibacteriia bacterium]